MLHNQAFPLISRAHGREWLKPETFVFGAILAKRIRMNLLSDALYARQHPGVYRAIIVSGPVPHGHRGWMAWKNCMFEGEEEILVWCVLSRPGKEVLLETGRPMRCSGAAVQRDQYP